MVVRLKAGARLFVSAEDVPLVCFTSYTQPSGDAAAATAPRAPALAIW